MSQTKVIGPFSQIITLDGLPLKGSLVDDELEIINHGGIYVKDGQVQEVALFDELKNKNCEIEEIEGHQVCLPGFVDAHTHACFAGSRARDFALRNSGKSYIEIAESGGGIWDTVTSTRNATQDQLASLLSNRVNKFLKNGVTTIEVKSGYGLSVDEELKMLRAIKQVADDSVAEIVSTCLAAHILPKDIDLSAADYLTEMILKLFPVLVKENLTKRVDAFIDVGAFKAEEMKTYFGAAKALGFDLTVHADQFEIGGSELAMSYGALSADHLEMSQADQIKALAKSSVISVALPGASLGLGCAFTPARKILDAGGALAIASDYNPGSAPMGDLLTQATILATFEKLSNAEVFAAICYRAAACLALTDRGRISKGYKADLVSFPVEDYQEITYHQGQLKPIHVWKNATRVHA